jgi:hypothetical protein
LNADNVRALRWRMTMCRALVIISPRCYALFFLLYWSFAVTCWFTPRYGYRYRNVAPLCYA